MVTPRFNPIGPGPDDLVLSRGERPMAAGETADSWSIHKLWLTQADLCEQLSLLPIALPTLHDGRRVVRGMGPREAQQVPEMLEPPPGKSHGGLQPATSCQPATPLYVFEMVELMDRLSEKTALLQYDLAQLEGERDQLLRDSEELKTAQYELMRTRDEIEAERDLLALQLHLSEAQCETALRERDELAVERQVLAEQNIALAGARDELVRQCDQLAHDRDRLLQVAKEAAFALSSAKQHIHGQQDQVDRLQAETLSMRLAVVEAAQAVGQANCDVKRLHCALENILDQIGQLARSPLAFPIRSRLRAILTA